MITLCNPTLIIRDQKALIDFIKNRSKIVPLLYLNVDGTVKVNKINNRKMIVRSAEVDNLILAESRKVIQNANKYEGLIYFFTAKDKEGHLQVIYVGICGSHGKCEKECENLSDNCEYLINIKGMNEKRCKNKLNSNLVEIESFFQGIKEMNIMEGSLEYQEALSNVKKTRWGRIGDEATRHFGGLSNEAFDNGYPGNEKYRRFYLYLFRREKEKLYSLHELGFSMIAWEIDGMDFNENNVNLLELENEIILDFKPAINQRVKSVKIERGIQTLLF